MTTSTNSSKHAPKASLRGILFTKEAIVQNSKSSLEQQALVLTKAIQTYVYIDF